MTTENLNVLEAVRFLCEGQGDIAEEIYNEVEAYWEPESPGVGFLSFTVEIGLRKDLINWKKLFENIEVTLTSPRYADHADTIRTHILEGFSNKVASGSLPARILLDNAGPVARAHMKSWELAMSGKTIF